MDHVSGSSEWETLRVLALLFCLVAAPGAAFGLARPRASLGRHAPEMVVAAGATVGLTVWVIVASLLTRLGALHEWIVWPAAVGVALLSCAAVVGTRVRQRRGTTAGAHAEYARRATGRRHALRSALLPFVVSSLAALPQLAIVVRRPDSLISPTAWYYWLNARSVAEAGGVPESVHEWGMSLPAFTFHSGFSAATAMLSVGSGDTASLMAAQAVRVVTVVSLGLGVWFLSRSLGASELTATCAVILAELVTIYAIKLSSLRPEALAYGLGCLTVALLLWGLRDRDWWLLAASAVGAVGVSQVHALSALMAVAMMLGTTAAYLLGLWGQGTWRARLALLASYAVAAAGGAAAAGLMFTGSVSEGSSAAGLPDLGADGFDPTWAFAQLVSDDPVPAALGAGAPGTGLLAQQSLEATLLGAPAWSVAVVCGFCALCLGVLVGKREAGREVWAVVAFAVVSFASMLVLAYILSLLGNTYVPRRTGFSRLLQLWPLVPLVAAAALAGRIAGRPWRELTAGMLVASTAATALVGVPRVLDLAGGQPNASVLDEMAALPIDSGSTVLTNAYTQGFVTLWTPGEGLMDGHAPYLERDLLAYTNTLLGAARAYFHNPAQAKFPYDEYGVDYVLAAKRPYALGTPANWDPRRLDRLARDPRLALTSETDDLVLYEVLPGE